MKKLLLLIAYVVTVTLLNATDLNLSGGLTFPHTNDGTTGINLAASLLIGPDGAAFYVEPGIRYKSLNFYNKYPSYYYIEESAASLNYIDLFTKVKFNPVQNFKTNVLIYPFIGMVAGISLGGEEEYSEGEGYKYTYDIKAKNMTGVLCSISLGMDVLINDKFIVGMEYDRALNSIFPSRTLKYRTLLINIGYKISM